MEERINKEKLLKLLSTLKVDKNEFWLLSSSMLMLRGISEDAGDLDLAVTNEGLKQLKSNYNIVYKDDKWFKIADNIECICDGEKDKLKYQPELIEDYYVQNILEYYEYIINSPREKDQKRIPAVEKYMMEKGYSNHVKTR